MSYILEALADSEQARQRIVAAPRYSLLPVIGEDLPHQRRWPYVLAGALLINAAVLQVWLRPALPGGAAPSKVSTEAQVTQTAAAPQPRIAPLARREQPAVDQASVSLRQATPPRPQPERVNERRIARPPAATDAIRGAASAGPANDSASVQQMPNLTPKVMGKRIPDAVVATQANPAPSASPSPISPSPTPTGGTTELPSALQKEMPAVSVAGFIRDEGSGSMVIVNDKLVREGDEVAPGVKLEKILNESLVFSYKGHRFTR